MKLKEIKISPLPSRRASYCLSLLSKALLSKTQLIACEADMEL